MSQGVLQLVDTLDAGGAERMALMLANQLARHGFRSHLCTTRRDGLLAELVAADVGRLRLGRRRRCEPGALRRLARYVRQQQIVLLHAHGTALFTAVLAALLPPHPAVIWHDHFGRQPLELRPRWPYWLATRRTSAVITVSEPLTQWAARQLRVAPERLWQVPNAVYRPVDSGSSISLPGSPGARIVCVANLRPEKDHQTLLQALALVLQQCRQAHLLLVGATLNPAYADHLRATIAQLGLQAHVSLLGPQRDVFAILRSCDIGVLSSISEGMPLALLEYGHAGLAAVATQVGQCAEMLDAGRAGLLVPPGAPQQLAAALLALLDFPARRQQLAEALRRRVVERYTLDATLNHICEIYQTVLGSAQRAR